MISEALAAGKDARGSIAAITKKTACRRRPDGVPPLARALRGGSQSPAGFG
jgi:hypothetical protein